MPDSVVVGNGASSEETLWGVPKWVLALAIGIPVAAGVAYVLLGSDDDDIKKKKSKIKQTATSKSKSDSSSLNQTASSKNSSKNVSLEDVGEDAAAEIVDPLERALAHKNKGNKFFRGGRYESAIKCYTEAIETCPKDKTQDLATFYQNRAAAYDQSSDKESEVLKDCDAALDLNPKYVKALERRAKTSRKLAGLKSIGDDEKVDKLKRSLEDITAVCILEGFQKQEHLMLVDSILKELGRAEATRAMKNRSPILASKHFIQQYFMSFAEDPISKSLDQTNGNNGDGSILSGYAKAKKYFHDQNYEKIIEACDEEINDENSSFKYDAILLRATFNILSKKQTQAFADLSTVIESEEADVKLRVNALIKRASLYIQQVKDPQKDPELSFNDFKKAEELDPENPDIYHHRGQVNLLMDQTQLAINDFNRSIQLNPNFPIAFVQKIFTECRKAIAEENSVEIKNCINAFEQALEKFPKCVETYALYAQVMSDRQDFDKSEELYKRAEKIDPNNANLLVHRALISLQSKGDVTSAVKMMEEALEIDERCEFAFETLGTVEVQRGNLKRAIELFDKAIPLTNTELELAHLFGLRDAAIAQTEVSSKLGFSLSNMGMM